MRVIILFTVILVSLIFLLNTHVPAEEIKTEDFFESMDIDKDGMICREEWEALDKDKDNIICKEEWEKWEYKSEPEDKSRRFDIKWYDNNGDGFMDQEEFYQYPRGRH